MAFNAAENIQGKEFVWTSADFERIQKLIYQRAGISLHAGKHAMVYSRLSRRLRETGYQSFKDYLRCLESTDGPEWQEFINALTTNLTSFFREAHHFKILADFLKSDTTSGNRNIWCSAASTGEEVYSIAITAMEALENRKDFFLTASDIDSKVLLAAAQGVYRIDALKDIDQERLQRFFLKGKGTNVGIAKVKPELREKIAFHMINLIKDDWPFRDPFDVVFCRNVMIYFDALTQRQVLERIHKFMRPGGLLFVGHAENFTDSQDLFSLKGKTVYERI